MGWLPRLVLDVALFLSCYFLCCTAASGFWGDIAVKKKNIDYCNDGYLYAERWSSRYCCYASGISFPSFVGNKVVCTRILLPLLCQSPSRSQRQVFPAKTRQDASQCTQKAGSEIAAWSSESFFNSSNSAAGRRFLLPGKPSSLSPINSFVTVCQRMVLVLILQQLAFHLTTPTVNPSCRSFHITSYNNLCPSPQQKWRRGAKAWHLFSFLHACRYLLYPYRVVQYQVSSISYQVPSNAISAPTHSHSSSNSHSPTTRGGQRYYVVRSLVEEQHSRLTWQQWKRKHLHKY